MSDTLLSKTIASTATLKLANIHTFDLFYTPIEERFERIVRQGQYMGPYVLNWVSIGGGHDGPNPRNLMEFINRVPQNAVLTVEGIMRHVYPLCTMGIAMGLHVRVG